MVLNHEETVEYLKKKISFWNTKMLNSRNMEERGVLDGKIKETKQKIKELEKEKSEQKVESLVDAPSVADRNESTIHLSRGQIMNSGDVFSITI